MARKSRPQLTLVGKCDITLNGQTVSYSIKRSMIARHVRLEMCRETGLVVVIPKQYPIRQLPSLLQEKQRWVLRNLQKYREAETRAPRNEWARDNTLPYLGRHLELVQRQSDGGADNVKLEEELLVVSLAPTSNGPSSVLEGWYRSEAAKLIRSKADELGAQLGVTYGRLSIRGQRTRWGSCSPRGNLSFNWKLMMAPEAVIDYVVIHELAHLKEMNHSKRFWQLVAEHCTHWRKHKKWLRAHDALLKIKMFP
jgi:predicted metal-dependent hydrolase